MTIAFFELRTPSDVLDKAKRDYAKMETATSTDTIFNFFVTTYHVIDYVKALGTVPESAIKMLYDDPDFRMCQFLCNKGKHIKLREVSPFEAKHRAGVTGGTGLGLDPVPRTVLDLILKCSQVRMRQAYPRAGGWFVHKPEAARRWVSWVHCVVLA